MLAVALLAAFVSLGATSAHAQATKTGWWIRVNSGKTEAASISFQVGTSKADSRAWRSWQQGQRVEFDLPTALRNAPRVYLRGLSIPHDKKAWFCVFYRDHGVEHFEFDGDQDHNMKPDDSEHDCIP